MIEKVSTFSRTVENLSKMGAYYTCIEHSKMISKLIQFPENEVSILEPAIGDSSALFAFLEDNNNRQKSKIFGVELNSNSYNMLKEQDTIDYLLNTDFLNGLHCSNNAFSLCFSNPPYGVGNAGERYESLFLKKIFNYMKKDGLLIYIIPYYIFLEDKNFSSKFTNRFDVEAVYKFHEKEFKKYQQIVIIGRAKSCIEDDDVAAGILIDKVLDIENLTLLPLNYNGEKITFRSSPESGITKFQKTFVDLNELENSYKRGKLLTKMNIYKKTKDLTLNPPICPKKGHLFLLGTTGFTSGTVGDEGHLHLQRGKVSNKEIVTLDYKKTKVVEITRTIKTTSIVLLENSGKITRLGG